MTHEELNEVLEELFEEEKQLRTTKGVEYSSDEDALSNFKRIAQDLGLSPFQVWYVYFKKHVDAIAHFCRTGNALSEAIHSRILDCRLYLALLEGLMREQESTTLPS